MASNTDPWKEQTVTDRGKRLSVVTICATRPSVCGIGNFRYSSRYVVLLLLFVMQLQQVEPKVFQEMTCKILQYEKSCVKMLNNTTPNPENGVYCPGEFDGTVCWKHTKPGTFVSEICPEYLNLNDDSLLAYRYCKDNGTWHQKNESGVLSVWSSIDECNPYVKNTSLTLDYSNDEAEREENMLKILSTTFTIGYAISLCCLFVALFLLTFFKKLHCTRNYIHMNLMISFIIRYITMIVKDKVLDSQYSFNRDLLDTTNLHESLQAYCDEFGGVSAKMISCRVSLTLMHYAIIANYFWLLAEGVYLQLLLVFSMSEYKYFPMFMAFGWGGPWIPVGVWVTLRIALANDGCWERYDEYRAYWALDIPVIISIVVNFVIFVNIVRILVSKLRAKNMTRTDYKYRLAKSTLALIPLLGIHYIVFLVVTNETVGSDSITLHVKVAFEMIFTSFQGCLIAILYCFLNGEVQTEIVKLWNMWRWKNGIPAANSRKCSSFYSNGTQLTSITSTHTTENTSNFESFRRESEFSSRRSTAYDQSISGNFNPLQPLIENGGNSLSVPQIAVNSV
ncbi:unnamed protein product [Clavelina lepadiformis]|uniref:Uncharacterized protein n=1 Tax=Clavelina lepadiformis TaxID=159417 RepID=A0ABP0FYE1_CLALP